MSQKQKKKNGTLPAHSEGVPGLPNWIPSNNARNCAVPNSNSLSRTGVVFELPYVFFWKALGPLVRMENTQKDQKKKQRKPENGGIMNEFKKTRVFKWKKHPRCFVGCSLRSKKNIGKLTPMILVPYISVAVKSELFRPGWTTLWWRSARFVTFCYPLGRVFNSQNKVTKWGYRCIHLFIGYNMYIYIYVPYKMVFVPFQI